MKTQESGRGLILTSALAAIVGSLCCLAPFVLLLLGLATLSTAVSLDNVLEGQYAWLFRLVALAFLAIALVAYFRKRGICTLDEARRQRNRILNIALITLLLAIGGYLAFNYFVLAYVGAAMGMPWQPVRGTGLVSVVLLVVGGVLYVRFLRRKSRVAPRE